MVFLGHQLGKVAAHQGVVTQGLGDPPACPDDHPAIVDQRGMKTFGQSQGAAFPAGTQAD